MTTLTCTACTSKFTSDYLTQDAAQNIALAAFGLAILSDTISIQPRPLVLEIERLPHAESLRMMKYINKHYKHGTIRAEE
jgi:hypothetical protein